MRVEGVQRTKKADNMVVGQQLLTTVKGIVGSNGLVASQQLTRHKAIDRHEPISFCGMTSKLLHGFKAECKTIVSACCH